MTPVITFCCTHLIVMIVVLLHVLKFLQKSNFCYTDKQLNDCNTHCVHLKMDESPGHKLEKRAGIRTIFIRQSIYLGILLCTSVVRNYTEVPASEVTTAPLKWLSGQQGADLSGEGKLGRFRFAGGVDGCQWRRPRLSHFLQRKTQK